MRHLLLPILLLAWLALPGRGFAQAVSDSLMRRHLASEGIPVTRNNQVKLLMSGHDKFVDLFQAIRRARHHVHLEYFNFRNDSIAGALFRLLAQKAREGVEVRALFDAFGNSSNNRPLRNRHLDSIRAQGIEIVKFDPLKFPYFNHIAHRDHRKIVVIDGRVGYTGGMNIADYYIHGLPKVGAWRDMHVRIEGDAVRYLQGIFLTTWNKETGQHVGGPQYFPDMPALPDSVARPVAIVDRTPHRTPRAMRQAYISAIDAAQHTVQIVNPYFVPTRSVRRALKRALKQGKEVEIMIPSVSDVPFTPEAALYYVHRLMKRGAHIYLYNGGFHHSKVMMVDSTFCTVGSTNLDARSLRHDYETNAFILHPATTAQLMDMFARDRRASTLLTPEVWKKRSGWKKFVGWFAHLLGPVL